MMKKMIAAVITLLTLTAIFPLFTAGAYEDYDDWAYSDYLSGVEDEFGVFNGNDYELEALNKEVRECSEKLGINIYVLIAGEAHYMSDSQTPPSPEPNPSSEPNVAPPAPVAPNEAPADPAPPAPVPPLRRLGRGRALVFDFFDQIGQRSASKMRIPNIIASRAAERNNSL